MPKLNFVPLSAPKRKTASKRTYQKKKSSNSQRGSSGSSLLKANMSFDYPPSDYQMGVLRFLREETGSCVVDAKAGAGKTSTLEMIAKNLNQFVQGKRQYVLMVAFNKSIVAELSQRMPKWIVTRTMHSVGFAAWARHVGGKINLDNRKCFAIMKELLTPKEYSRMSSVVSKLVSLAKNSGIGTWLMEDTDTAWNRLIVHHCIDIGEPSKEEEFSGDYKSKVISVCRKVLAENNKMRSVIDFDDMLYLPVFENIYLFQNHLVFVDESQDLNMIQLAFLKKVTKKDGRLIAVGDPWQAIYGFRGADSRAIEKLTKWFKCATLPLSICYRCDKAIVAEAQKFVESIEPFDKNGEGKVETLSEYDEKTFKVGDVILCRNTAPLIRFAYTLISRRIACKVMGREIGKGLIKLIKDLKSSTIEQLGQDLNQWVEKHTVRLSKEETGESAIQILNDKAECIRIFMKNLAPSDFTVSGLCSSINDLFSDSDEKDTIQLGTVHRSKGHEWDRVFILDRHLMPSRSARLEWQRRQEHNLQYVAVTRAKHYLGYINSNCWKQ